MHVAWWLQRGMGLTWSERCNRAGEASVRKVAFMLPRRVVYWCVIRAGVHATSGPWGNQHPMTPTLDAILQRWDYVHTGERSGR
jgi:hypothetical protein